MAGSVVGAAYPDAGEQSGPCGQDSLATRPLGATIRTTHAPATRFSDQRRRSHEVQFAASAASNGPTAGRASWDQYQFDPIGVLTTRPASDPRQTGNSVF